MATATVPHHAKLVWPCGCYTHGPDHELTRCPLHEAAEALASALQAALEALQADVAGDCPHCNGEGSWTDDEPPRMIPVRHMTDCPITLARAALQAAGHTEATPCR